MENLEETIRHPELITGGDGTQSKLLGEWMLVLLKDSYVRVINCNGWDGVGRWRIAEEATKIAMESKVFDVLIQVKLLETEWSPRNLQMRIADQLKIKLPMLDDDGHGDMEAGDPEYTDRVVAKEIQTKLEDKTFLLVIGEVSRGGIDLGYVGVPNVRVRTRRSAAEASIGSKVILIGHAQNVMPFDWDFSLNLFRDYGKIIYDGIGFNLFLDEIAEVAHSSRGKFLPDTVIFGLMYMSLFDIKIADEEKLLLRYWMVQGFIDAHAIIERDGEEKELTLEEEEDILVEEVMKPLLNAFADRFFVQEYRPYEVPPHIKELVRKAGKSNLWHKFRMDENHLPRAQEDENEEWRSIAIIMNTDEDSGAHVNSLPSCPKWPNLTALIIKCVSQNFQFDIKPDFFLHMECLCVLDLRFAPVTTLPSSISSLRNLRLLRLKGCKMLTAIPTSFQALEKLEFLDLSDCDSLEIIPEEAFDRMRVLRVLDLSNSGIMSLTSSISNLHGLQQLLLASCESLSEIHEMSFKGLHLLQVLNLSGAAALESLPSSLSNLVGLKKLNLNDCSSLKTMGLGVEAHLLRNLSKLEVLDLGMCLALEDIHDVCFGDVVPNIKKINLLRMRSPKRLSFEGCQRLEHLILGSHENLEVINLSGTIRLKKFNFRSFNEAHPLRRWDLLPINYNGVQDVLFEGLNRDDNDVGARIWVSDAHIFDELDEGFFKAKCFSRFHVRISSSTEEKPSMPIPMGNSQNINFQKNQFAYKDMYSHIQTRLFSNFRGTYSRHLEIFRSKVSSLNSLWYLLSHAELLTVFEDNSLKGCGYHTPTRLKECRIGSCQKMEIIFDMKPYLGNIFECLEVIWASDLTKLTTVCYFNPNYSYDPRSFAFLKHMHLERCPQLVTVFNVGFYFESLETLEIKFCGRLKVVFGNQGEAGGGSFQKLRSLCLWQLPKLESICSGYLPKLQKMRVRGCGKLRKLPLQVPIIEDQVSYDASDNVSPVAEIEGEMNWWNNLQWADVDASSIQRPVRFTACSRVPVKQQK